MEIQRNSDIDQESDNTVGKVKVSENFEINEKVELKIVGGGGQKVNLSGLSPKLKHVLVTNGAAAELTARMLAC